MSLIPKLEAALVEQSLGKSTGQCYKFWVRKFYAHCRKPASQWTGADVRAWMLHLAGENYSAVSRKQGLDAARGVSPLDAIARPVSPPLMIGGFA